MCEDGRSNTMHQEQVWCVCVCEGGERGRKNVSQHYDINFQLKMISRQWNDCASIFLVECLPMMPVTKSYWFTAISNWIMYYFIQQVRVCIECAREVFKTIVFTTILCRAHRKSYCCYFRLGVVYSRTLDC